MHLQWPKIMNHKRGFGQQKQPSGGTPSFGGGGGWVYIAAGVEIEVRKRALRYEMYEKLNGNWLSDWISNFFRS